MRRKIYRELVTWKNTQAGRSALLIEGAGCVGKSYAVEEFAKNEYRSYVLIDFNSAPEDVTTLFHDGVALLVLGVELDLLAVGASLVIEL